jgi:hypothetical protein
MVTQSYRITCVSNCSGVHETLIPGIGPASLSTDSVERVLSLPTVAQELEARARISAAGAAQ